MAPVRPTLLALILALAGCSRDPAEVRQTLTGSDAAVAGLPRYDRAGRFKVESCCTFQLGPGARSQQLQAVDSIGHDVLGPGYVLHVIYGPYDGAQPDTGYRLAGKQTIDGVKLAAFRWADRSRKPSEGRLLWLAQVGGGRIDGVNHTPWGLRIMGDCGTPAACRASAAMVGTIRF